MIKRSIFLFFLIMFGCSKETLLETQELGEIRVVQGTIRRLAAAYREGDWEAFSGRISPTFPDRIGMLRAIETDFESFDPIYFSFEEERIWIESQTYQVSVLWDGRWQRRDSGITTRRNGLAIFHLIKGEGEASYKVVEIGGENPFIHSVAGE